jgi:DNA helicase-2/ATP-dependent DNA helicase PcrA
MVTFKPRPKQAEVLNFRKGRMGVSAVPGSGKTRTLSYLAANLVAEGRLKDDQEVLIVTLVNAAARHFAHQVAGFIQERGLLHGFGYRVRTLHGLANDIVRERPDLALIDTNFKIVAENEADEILQDAVNAWLGANTWFGEQYLDPEFDENKVTQILNNNWRDEVKVIAGSFIKQAKDLRLDPKAVRRGIDRFGQELPLAEMCHAIYVSYQRGLSYRGGVDFQDLIRLALKVLEADPEYLKRMQYQWPYILEDEAQDSSKLQEDILRLLVGKKGNWVRVGDPNQAIYETFTTARPEFLLNFLEELGVQGRQLPNSGRSTQSIINLANALIDWSLERHPVEAVRDRKPLNPPHIEPTPKDDPQPNPPDSPAQVHIFDESLTPAEEMGVVIQSLKRWLPDNPERTAAVLVPRNERGAQVVKLLKQEGIEAIELLRSTSSTREAAGSLVHLLLALTNPNASTPLANAYRVWRRDDRGDRELEERIDRVTKTLRGLKQVEDYLHPRSGVDWLDSPAVGELIADDDSAHDRLVEFRTVMRRWQEAVLLPVDQLILTLAQELFVTAADLAIAHSLAVYMRQQAEAHPLWRLPEFTTELQAVAQNRRRILDLIGDDADPESQKGKVTVATMHSAKGLEWDRVYLMSINNYDFPSAEPQDSFIGEKWFVRGQLNLQAEALEQLERLADELPFPYEEGKATEKARVEYASERLRLLYVGITRARRELVITYNTGRDGNMYQATPLIGLSEWWKQQK